VRVAGTLNANLGGSFIQNGTAPQAGANFNVGGNGIIGGVLSAERVVSVADVPNLLARSASPRSPLCGADTNGDLVVDVNDLPALIERLFGE
jgi:hypothetical protein